MFNWYNKRFGKNQPEIPVADLSTFETPNPYSILTESDNDDNVSVTSGTTAFNEPTPNFWNNNKNLLIIALGIVLIAIIAQTN